MICCFFGHRNVVEGVRESVRECLVRLITKENATKFYVGTHGELDRIVYGELKKLKREYPSIDYAVVLAYFPKNETEYDPQETVYPEGLERVPKRAAIVARNHWMIRSSDCVVVWTRGIGNSSALADFAAKQGKRVIHLA